jgi:hypothetical protein
MAYAEYEIPVPGGGTASVAFTLSRLEGDGMVAEVGRLKGAQACGMLSILDYPGAPRHPAIWMRTDGELTLLVAEEDGEIDAAVRQVIDRYIEAFFAEIAPIAPELAGAGERFPV